MCKSALELVCEECHIQVMTNAKLKSSLPKVIQLLRRLLYPSKKQNENQVRPSNKRRRASNSRSAPEARAFVTLKEIVGSFPSGGGTGFFISEDGFLITNEHVVRDAAQVRLVMSAGLISARVVKVDAANDLALLKAEGRFAPLPTTASRRRTQLFKTFLNRGRVLNPCEPGVKAVQRQ